MTTTAWLMTVTVNVQDDANQLKALSDLWRLVEEMTAVLHKSGIAEISVAGVERLGGGATVEE